MRISGWHMRLVIVMACFLFLAVRAVPAPASGLPPQPAADGAELEQVHYFSGGVFDESTNPVTGIEGVTVSLYCSGSCGYMGLLLTSTTTDGLGNFSLATTQACQWYHVIEINPPGYESSGSTTVDGPCAMCMWTLDWSGWEWACIVAGSELWVKFYDRPIPTPTATPTSPAATPTRTATPTATPGQQHVFSGAVFNGAVGNETQPLEDVTVRLYCSQSDSSWGSLENSTTTLFTGDFALGTTTICDPEGIDQSNLPGYQSVGATSATGWVHGSDWIYYPASELPGLDLSSNKFWDRPVGGTPTATRTATRTRTSTLVRTATRTRTPTRTATATRTPTRVRFTPIAWIRLPVVMRH